MLHCFTVMAITPKQEVASYHIIWPTHSTLVPWLSVLSLSCRVTTKFKRNNYSIYCGDSMMTKEQQSRRTLMVCKWIHCKEWPLALAFTKLIQSSRFIIWIMLHHNHLKCPCTFLPLNVLQKRLLSILLHKCTRLITVDVSKTFFLDAWIHFTVIAVELLAV